MASILDDFAAEFNGLLYEWNTFYESYAKSLGLSYTSLTILSKLHSAEGCTQKQLSETCFLPKQTVNNIISMYVRKGVVRLTEIDEDRRNKAIYLTDIGRELAMDVIGRVRNAEHEAAKRLTDTQRDTLLALTHAYVTGCAEALHPAPPG